MLRTPPILLIASFLACAGSPVDNPIVGVPRPPGGGVSGGGIGGNGTPNANLAFECDRARAEWVWCDDFDRDRLGSYFEVSTAGGAFVRTEGTGRAGSTGMRVTFRRGTVDAGFLHLALGKTPQSYFRPADAGTQVYRELWWRAWVHYGPEWTGGGGVKLMRMFNFASAGSWAQGMIAHVWSGGPGDQHLVLDPASGYSASGRLVSTKYNDFANLRWLGSVRTSPVFAPGVEGRWLCIETHVRLNTPGQANGVFETWIDGRREAGRADLDWGGPWDQYGLNALYLENYWNDGAPGTQTRTFDNLVVSTAPIGCA